MLFFPPQSTFSFFSKNLMKLIILEMWEAQRLHQYQQEAKTLSTGANVVFLDEFVQLSQKIQIGNSE